MLKARRRTDTAARVASDLRAPAAERYDAHLQAASEVRHAVPDAQELLAAARAFAKAAPAPLEDAEPPKPALARASVNLADTERQPITLHRPVGLDFPQLRAIVKQDPVLQTIIQTRINQVRRFLRPSREEWKPGFAFRFRDPSREVNEDDQPRFAFLSNYLLNSGAEFDPRMRRRLRRDTLSEFITKHLQDSLALDSAPIELVTTAGGRAHGYVAVDGARVYLTDPDEGLVNHTDPPPNHVELGLHIPDPEEVIAVLTKMGRVEAHFTHDDLLYPIRRPSTDRLQYGYGQPEPEDLIKIVTGFLNALILNLRGFTHNAIPKGILTLFGDFVEEDLEEFRSEWNAYVRGLNNRWSVPVLVSQDQQSGASWTNTGNEYNEMYFAKWMTFLVAIKAGLYGMDPEEIAFESFTTHASALSGSDTEERLASSKDKGLVPLLDHLAQVFNDLTYLVDPEVEFYWTGLLPEQQHRKEQYESALTYGEFREQQGLPTTGEPMLDNAPMAQQIAGVYQTVMNQQMQAQMQAEQMQAGGMDPSMMQQEQDPNASPEALAAWADADEDGNHRFADADDPEAAWSVQDGSSEQPTGRLAKAQQPTLLDVDLDVWP